MGRSRIDANQVEIMRGLRSIGATVQSLADVGKGCPDLLIGFQGRNIVVEVKDGKKTVSRRRLTPAEEEWQQLWRGQVAIVTNLDEALAVIGAKRSER